MSYRGFSTNEEAGANARLVTLVGAGGIGKTRLAVEVGASLTGTFDGVAMVTLHEVSSADLDGIPLAIELAASRAKVVGPEELLRRLDARAPIATRPPPRGELQASSSEASSADVAPGARAPTDMVLVMPPR